MRVLAFTVFLSIAVTSWVRAQSGTLARASEKAAPLFRSSGGRKAREGDGREGRHPAGRLKFASPVDRIATGVKTGDNKQSVIVFHNEQRVGKAAQESAAHPLMNDGKLQRIGAHAVNQGVNRFSETAA